MKDFSITNQALFEIAMAIGNSFDLKQMLAEGLDAYLRKFDCSSCMVLKRKEENQGGAIPFEPVYSIPEEVHKTHVWRFA